MQKNQRSGSATTRPPSCSEEEGEEEERVSNAQRGRVRLHGVVQSSTGLEVDDDRRKSLGEKGWARRSVVVRAVGPSGAAVFEAVPGREEYGAGEDGGTAKDKIVILSTHSKGNGGSVAGVGG
jgi:hypothetical protein